jgi:hypothetical protein
MFRFAHDAAGVSAHPPHRSAGRGLERLMWFPCGYWAFAVWYLRDKAIRADGINFDPKGSTTVESASPGQPVFHKLFKG